MGGLAPVSEEERVTLDCLQLNVNMPICLASCHQLESGPIYWNLLGSGIHDIMQASGQSYKGAQPLSQL